VPTLQTLPGAQVTEQSTAAHQTQQRRHLAPFWLKTANDVDFRHRTVTLATAQTWEIAFY